MNDKKYPFWTRAARLLVVALGAITVLVLVVFGDFRNTLFGLCLGSLQDCLLSFHIFLVDILFLVFAWAFIPVFIIVGGSGIFAALAMRRRGQELKRSLLLGIVAAIELLIGSGIAIFVLGA